MEAYKKVVEIADNDRFLQYCYKINAISTSILSSDLSYILVSSLRFVGLKTSAFGQINSKHNIVVQMKLS